MRRAPGLAAGRPNPSPGPPDQKKRYCTSTPYVRGGFSSNVLFCPNTPVRSAVGFAKVGVVPARRPAVAPFA